eukprot:comp9727_c0_seq1/m.4702 comp9727_c0_seq1/g.4702  ORF comp9727_c0_seq1/g.4702 comp9727_c0_seq1/m.4702 type:complete len:145 (-) comp9727_c0_seq1:25-459(-)
MPDPARSSQFLRDAEEGFTSSNFDLQANIDHGDERPGLTDDKYLIRQIMLERAVDFDTARLVLSQQRMREAGIDPDTGMPLDSRAVTFDSMRSRTVARTPLDRLVGLLHNKRRLLVASAVLACVLYFLLSRGWSWWAPEHVVPP